MLTFCSHCIAGLHKQESEDVTSAAGASASRSVGLCGPKSLPSARPFCLKPIPSNISPVLVFINPKSGGNQGAKLMQKFQWLLNPRQVFDMFDHTQGGPQPAIEMFRRVANVRLLACGGDGTVGWLLSVMDKMQLAVQPPVSVLPLGTGNDLSRSLGWGGGYMDEPISKILTGLSQADEVRLDRWQLKVTRNTSLEATEKRGENSLPLNVVNNYFSFGVCAQIALQFHEAREANPEKFNSRIRNKMYYGQAGGKNFLLRKWRDLSDDIELVCDGRDLTSKLREHRVHSVLFSNIPYFSSGTRPWNSSMGEQRIDDGLIEVIGLTTNSLPKLLAGGKGICIAQCKSATIKTRKTIPMQVDGEARRLNPATIELSLLNQVRMLAKRKGANPKTKRYSVGTESSEELLAEDPPLRLAVAKILMRDYASNHLDKEKLRRHSAPFGDVNTTCSGDLEQVRALVNELLENNDGGGGGKGDGGSRKASGAGGGGAEVVVPGKLKRDWVFIDSVTAMRFFR
jgi:diacylglycerol kinase (ATP)